MFTVHGFKSIAILLSLTFSLHAYAADVFGVEAPLSDQVSISASILSELGTEIDLQKNGCVENKLEAALEATQISMSQQSHAVLVKPRAKCLCGANYCPIWIYQLNRNGAKRIWSTPGTGFVELLDKKNKGYRQIREGGGTAGHNHVGLWVWDGKKYRLTKKKSHLDKDVEEKQ